MKTGILKNDLTSPRWSHCVGTIPKGTKVKYTEQKSIEGDIMVEHPTQSVLILCQKSKYIK
jgi:hypothetical protein